MLLIFSICGIVWQDSNSNMHTKELEGNVLARLGFELQFKSLMAFNFEEYSDLEAPPGLSEANHGPIVFFRPKRRKRILTPPGFHPHAEPQAHP